MLVFDPLATAKGRDKRKRSHSPVLHALELLLLTDAELRAENARLGAENQELERELETVKADFHNSGLVNQRLEIIEVHRKKEKKLKDIILDSN